MNNSQNKSNLSSPALSESVAGSFALLRNSELIRNDRSLLSMTTKEKMAGVKLRFMLLYLLTVAIGMFQFGK